MLLAYRSTDGREVRGDVIGARGLMLLVNRRVKAGVCVETVRVEDAVDDLEFRRILRSYSRFAAETLEKLGV